MEYIDDVTTAFCALAASRFVVLLFDCTTNQGRKQLFIQKVRAIDGLPPTQAALIQHTKRAAYQAGHCWGQMMVAAPELPMTQEDGKLTGPLYQKLPRHAVNSSSVGVQHAREDANVPRHHFSVLHFATVVDCVLITLFAYHFCSLVPFV